MYGVIDIGSNTIRLVIYKVEEGTIRQMINKKISVGLAGYVNDDNRLSDIGIEKAINALKNFKEILSYVKIKEIFPFATASLRNIENSREVVHRIKNEVGFNVKILSGVEEGIYDYRGSLQSVNMESGTMVDIGGGSTEIVFFNNNEVIEAYSLKIGSLNMYKKNIEGLIPTKKEIKKITGIVDSQLKNSGIIEKLKVNKSIKYSDICGVGGTARAIQKVLKETGNTECNEYDESLLEDILRKLIDKPEKFYKELIKVAPDRIHTFAPGLIILERIAKLCESKKVVTSRYGVREGFLLYTLEERGIM